MNSASIAPQLIWPCTLGMEQGIDSQSVPQRTEDSRVYRNSNIMDIGNLEDTNHDNLMSLLLVSGYIVVLSVLWTHDMSGCSRLMAKGKPY